MQPNIHICELDCQYIELYLFFWESDSYLTTN